jgi:hypothetical protein
MHILMKDSLTKVLMASFIIALSGCISVHEREPEAVSTTTTTRHTAIVPASTTVERTTVY